VHVRTATSRPVKGYEKTARELVIWAGEQMQAHPEKVFDDMEDAFSGLPDDDEAGGGRVLSKVYPKTARASVLRLCLPQVHRERRHNIIGSKLSNTEKIERPSRTP
jgi:hypothetical protein